MIDLEKLWSDDNAATLVEYSLVIALIAVVVIAAGQTFGVSLHAMYQRIAATFSAA